MLQGINSSQGEAATRREEGRDKKIIYLPPGNTWQGTRAREIVRLKKKYENTEINRETSIDRGTKLDIFEGVREKRIFLNEHRNRGRKQTGMNK